MPTAYLHLPPMADMPTPDQWGGVATTTPERRLLMAILDEAHHLLHATPPGMLPATPEFRRARQLTVAWVHGHYEAGISLALIADVFDLDLGWLQRMLLTRPRRQHVGSGRTA